MASERALDAVPETTIYREVSLTQAAAQLTEMVRQVHHGTEITIVEDGRPLARLVPPRSREQPRIAGLNEGEAWISDDFDAELPDEFWLGKE